MDNIVEGVLVILKKGGYVLIPIFIIAQIGWYYVFERLWYLYASKGRIKAFWKSAPKDREDFEKFLRSTNYKRGLFGKVIQNFSKVPAFSVKSLSQSAQEVINENALYLQRHMKTIAVLAYSAPLLGLLGTVSGMIATFKIITIYGVGNPAMMAEGISEALLTTQAGLVVSFPLLIMHNYLMNRADAVETDCILNTTKVINILR